MATTQSGGVDLANLIGTLSPIFLGQGAKTTSANVNPGIATLLNNVNATASNNANNPNATDSIIQNIMRIAAQNFAPITAQQNSSGMYNSTVLSMLQNQAEAEATQQAALPVLNFKTQQEQIAASSASDLLRATTGSTTKQAPSLSSTLLQAGLLGLSGVTGLKSGISAYKAISEKGIGRATSDYLGITDPATKTPAATTGTGGTTTASVDAANSGLIADPTAANYTPGSVSTGGLDVSGGAVPVSSAPDAFASATAPDFGAGLGNSLEASNLIAAQTPDAPSGASTDELTQQNAAAEAQDPNSGLSAGEIGGVAAGGVAAGVGGAALAGAFGSTVELGAVTAVGEGAAAAEGGSLLETIGTAAAAAWIICTELKKQGKMPARHYYYGSKVFANYWEYGKRGYYIWAIPSVRHLRRNPTSYYSKTLGVVFRARAEHLAANAGCKEANKSILGFAVTHGLWWVCAALAITVCQFVKEERYNPYKAGVII